VPVRLRLRAPSLRRFLRRNGARHRHHVWNQALLNGVALNGADEALISLEEVRTDLVRVGVSGAEIIDRDQIAMLLFF
jgi:hypothetical protein